MSTVGTDRFTPARAVADAVLYEGYVLYPYRASSPKNQVRWQFGVLTPRAFAEADGSERWAARTECLIDSGSTPGLAVRMRCLQLQHRSVAGLGPDGELRPVDGLRLDDALLVDWDEAVEQVADLSVDPLDPEVVHELNFTLPEGTDDEMVRAADGSLAGRIRRHRRAVDGRLSVTATSAGPGGRLIKVSVTVQNTTSGVAAGHRDEALAHSLLAVHTMLAVDHGAFISVLDPPAWARAEVEDCHSEGTFPVLVGDDVMLSSPIILYDHPEVAPESPGDLYDATEIDEILALRVLTLTEEEKAEARGTDPRAGAIIDRCDDLAPAQWERLHGTMRVLGDEGSPCGTSAPWAAATAEGEPWWDPATDGSVDPWTDTVRVGGVTIAKGARVRLRPSHRADAQDIFLIGLTATVAGVFRDVDGETHVAVTVDDDPGRDELAWQGRYLFFYPDEVDPLAGAGETR